MKKLINIIFLIFIAVLVFTAGCENIETKQQQEYNRCTAVCASVLGEDFITLKLCMDECKAKFLDENT